MRFQLQLRSTQERQHKQIREDVDDQPRQDHETEALRRREIREDKNGKPGGKDDVGINDAAPLFFAAGYPR